MNASAISQTNPTLPGTAPSKMFMPGYRGRHCVIGLEPLSEIGSWKVGMPNSNFNYYFGWKVITFYSWLLLGRQDGRLAGVTLQYPTEN